MNAFSKVCHLLIRTEYIHANKRGAHDITAWLIRCPRPSTTKLPTFSLVEGVGNIDIKVLESEEDRVFKAVTVRLENILFAKTAPCQCCLDK